MRRAIWAMITLATLLTFQNCGRMSETATLLTDPNRLSRLSFEDTFNYEYNSEPKVFGQVQFVSKDTSKDFTDVAYVAVMGRADGAVGVFDYEISLTNQDGFPVCPSKSGRLMGGATSVIDGCVSQANSTAVIVDLKVTEIEGAKKTVYHFQRKY